MAVGISNHIWTIEEIVILAIWHRLFWEYNVPIVQNWEVQKYLSFLKNLLTEHGQGLVVSANVRESHIITLVNLTNVWKRIILRMGPAPTHGKLIVRVGYTWMTFLTVRFFVGIPALENSYPLRLWSIHPTSNPTCILWIFYAMKFGVI